MLCVMPKKKVEKDLSDSAALLTKSRQGLMSPVGVRSLATIEKNWQTEKQFSHPNLLANWTKGNHNQAKDIMK